MKRAMLIAALATLAVACSKSPSPSATAQAETAYQSLERLDTRRPVPLMPVMAAHQKAQMRGHLEAVQAITAALARDDLDTVAREAPRLGSSEAMAGMCTHLGAAAPGFTETALTFHRTADTLTEAARRRDRAGTLNALDHTLQTCTGCHATWRQQIVDEATWQRLASRAHAPQAAGTH